VLNVGRLVHGVVPGHPGIVLEVLRRELRSDERPTSARISHSHTALSWKSLCSQTTIPLAITHHPSLRGTEPLTQRLVGPVITVPIDVLPCARQPQSSSAEHPNPSDCLTAHLPGARAGRSQCRSHMRRTT
jgi:hypothetical protein